MAIPVELRVLSDKFFELNAHKYFMDSIEGCGKYMEAFVPHAQKNGFPKVVHLRKRGGTMYNSHAIDSFLYNEVTENGKLGSVDIIQNAETDHASAGWSPDEPRYTKEDIWDGEGNSSTPVVPKKKFPGYEEIGGDAFARSELGKAMLFDWREAGRLEDAPHKAIENRRVVIDNGFVIWVYRTLYDAFDDILNHDLKASEAMNKSLNKHRVEWRAELGLRS